ncbi:GNAT family N-acetyltransferase [bacterium]|nr:MAG: GNAT family N-acetyltransferase [bacterium]
MEIRLADYTNPQDQESIKTLLNAYAMDPMGGGKALGQAILNKVLQDMITFPGAFSVLAFVDGSPVGLANCFTGYSTFKAAPLINIHDLAVLSESRGKQIGAKLIEKVAEEAQKRGCCKITLEVRDDNRAKNLYLRAGFEEGKPPMEFLTKEI